MAQQSLWMASALLLAASWSLSAAPLPCVNDTLLNYTGLSMGCTIDNTLFSSFRALPNIAGMAGLIDPNAIQVMPLHMPGSAGFRFQLNQSASAGELFGILIGYSVSGALGGTVGLDGSSVLPDGVNTAVLNLCRGAYDPTGPIGCTGAEALAIAFDDGVNRQLSSSTGLSPGSMDLYVDAVVDGGLGGRAALDAVTVVSDVPEPTMLPVLLSGGLVAWLYQKKNRKESV